MVGEGGPPVTHQVRHRAEHDLWPVEDLARDHRYGVGELLRGQLAGHLKEHVHSYHWNITIWQMHTGGKSTNRNSNVVYTLYCELYHGLHIILWAVAWFIHYTVSCSVVYTLYCELQCGLHVKLWAVVWLTHYTVNCSVVYTLYCEL